MKEPHLAGDIMEKNECQSCLIYIQCSCVKVQLPSFSANDFSNYLLSLIKPAKLENSQYDCSGGEIHQIQQRNYNTSLT